MNARLIRQTSGWRFKPAFQPFQPLKPFATVLSTALLAAVPAFGALIFLPTAAIAQSQYQTDADAPARVGRLAYASGGVQFFSEAEPQWRAAQLNEPVTSRNSLLTDSDARAEVRVGPAAFSLDSNSQIDISQLDDHVFSSNLVRGTLSVRMSHMDDEDVIRVNTPNGEFELERAGRYRIDADDNASRVTVFSGRAQAIGSNGSIQVDAGKSLRVSNQGGGESFMFGPASSTGFDGWTLARDERYREGPSVKYVSRNMTGYEDLDANGRWTNDADYGPVWYPTTHITAGWAPYRYGRWAWVAPWGWTWIDDAPWGFAPFHYGRWVSIGGTWAWTPGAYVARPVFAPALVGFYGGSNFSISFSVGGPSAALGWYPLAPWERYAPSYTRNVTYINRVNNITIINPPSRYARHADYNRVRGGTLIRQADFGNRREVGRFAARNVPEEVIRRAPLASPTVLPRPAPERPASWRTVQSGGPEFHQQPGPSQFSRDRRPDYEQERERQRERMGDRRDDRGNSRQEWARPNADRPAALAIPQAPQQLPDPRSQSSTPSRFNRDSQQDDLRFEQRRQQEREQAYQQQLQREEQQREQQRRERQYQEHHQQREFERRQGPVRMEALPNQQPVPQQWQRNEPYRNEPQRHERRMERMEAPRQERPAALNVSPPPQAQPQPQAPVPSRFNQQPQGNENQGNRDNNGRGGGRFRSPEQQ